MTLRSNVTELRKEIQATRDRMNTFPVESEEHKRIHDQYVALLDREKELKELDISKVKVAATVVGPIAGLFIYRKMFDTSAEPFFKDFGRSILMSFKHI